MPRAVLSGCFLHHGDNAPDLSIPSSRGLQRSVCPGCAGVGRSRNQGLPGTGWDEGQWGLCAVRSPVSGATGRHSPTSRLLGFCVGFMVWEYCRSGCISIFALCPFPKTTSLLLFVTVEFPHFSQSVVTKEIQPCFGPVAIGTGFPGLLLFVLPNCWCLAAVFSLGFS